MSDDVALDERADSQGLASVLYSDLVQGESGQGRTDAAAFVGGVDFGVGEDDPAVARYRPDAVVVWFDAHADLNTPSTTTTGYLGGLALSGPLGLWDSGLGAGLGTASVVLVGGRDLDPAEQLLVDEGTIALVPVRTDMADLLRSAIGCRPVYVHFDCDVLEPDTVPTDYLVPGGMSLTQLHECAATLAASEIIGVEIGELEATRAVPDYGPARQIVAAFDPLLSALRRTA